MLLNIKKVVLTLIIFFINQHTNTIICTTFFYQQKSRICFGITYAGFQYMSQRKYFQNAMHECIIEPLPGHVSCTRRLSTRCPPLRARASVRAASAWSMIFFVLRKQMNEINDGFVYITTIFAYILHNWNKILFQQCTLNKKNH